jgi:Zinc carboxypeptidase
MPIFSSNIEHENSSQLFHGKKDTDVVDLKSQDKSIVDSKLIGRTPRKRRINVILIGEKKVNPKLKIFIMAGQHGDERYSRKAAERLISHLVKTKAEEFSDLGIAILPNANPDGAYKNRRRTSSGIDMNRDHLLLISEENQAIHSFIRSWKPNLIVDVHNYPPKRKYLEEKNYVFYHDVLIDVPTNLAIQKRPDQDKLKSLIQDIQSDLKQFNYSCERYVLVDEKGIVRHSTADIVDARNFLSLRYNTFTILVEGKEPLPGENQKGQIERTVSAQFEALLSILKWANKNTNILISKDLLTPYKTGDTIAIRFKFKNNKQKQTYKMNFENTITKKIEEVVFPNYESSLIPTRFVKMPSAYAIPKEKDSVIHVLHSHGLLSESPTDSKLYKVRRYLILSSMPSKASTKNKPRQPIKVSQISTDEEQFLSNYEVFPTSQEGGHCLPFLLEPQSEYGLHRYKDLNLNPEPGLEYPILRVVSVGNPRRIKGS